MSSPTGEGVISEESAADRRGSCSSEPVSCEPVSCSSPPDVEPNSDFRRAVDALMDENDVQAREIGQAGLGSGVAASDGSICRDGSGSDPASVGPSTGSSDSAPVERSSADASGSLDVEAGETPGDSATDDGAITAVSDAESGRGTTGQTAGSSADAHVKRVRDAVEADAAVEIAAIDAGATAENHENWPEGFGGSTTQPRERPQSVIAKSEKKGPHKKRAQKTAANEQGNSALCMFLLGALCGIAGCVVVYRLHPGAPGVATAGDSAFRSELTHQGQTAAVYLDIIQCSP